MPEFIKRYSKPSELDEFPKNTIILVQEDMKDELQMWMQTSTDEHAPKWEFVGFHKDN